PWLLISWLSTRILLSLRIRRGDIHQVSDVLKPILLPVCDNSFGDFLRDSLNLSQLLLAGSLDIDLVFARCRDVLSGALETEVTCPAVIQDTIGIVRRI